MMNVSDGKPLITCEQLYFFNIFTARKASLTNILRTKFEMKISLQYMINVGVKFLKTQPKFSLRIMGYL